MPPVPLLPLESLFKVKGHVPTHLSRFVTHEPGSLFGSVVPPFWPFCPIVRSPPFICPRSPSPPMANSLELTCVDTSPNQQCRSSKIGLPCRTILVGGTMYQSAATAAAMRQQQRLRRGRSHEISVRDGFVQRRCISKGLS